MCTKDLGVRRQRLVEDIRNALDWYVSINRRIDNNIRCIETRN